MLIPADLETPVLLLDERRMQHKESVAAAEQLTLHGLSHYHCHEAMIEIDTDGHRSGLEPADPRLEAVARALRTEDGYGARLTGVMTHAGSSYALRAPEALAAMAERERAGCVEAARRLRAAGPVHRHRPPSRCGLDHHRRRMDGREPRPPHAAAGPGLRVWPR